MPSTPAGIVVEPNGHTVTVNITTAAGAAVAVYTTFSGSTAHSLPGAFTTRTEFWLPRKERYVVSMLVDGTENANHRGGTLTVDLSGGGVHTIQAGAGDGGQGDSDDDDVFDRGAYERLRTVDLKDNPYANLVGDGRELSDVSISLGSQTVTSPSAPFTAADVGKVITLTGAGAAGGTLTSRPAGNPRLIVSVSADGTQATFDDPSHSAAATAVVGPRTVTAATTRGSRTVTAADGAFTASDVGKDITIPLCFGNDRPSVLSQVGVTTAGSAVVTSANPCFLANHVGQYVRIARAGGSGGFLVGKVLARTSSTSITLDINATDAVTNAEVVLLGAPRTALTKITGVTDGTTITVQRTADFTVAPVASTVSGGYALFATDDGPAFDTLLAALPRGAVVTVPEGVFAVGLSGSHVIGTKPVTFRGLTPAASILHIGASPSRLVPGGSNVTWEDLTFQALPAVSLELFGNAAAGSDFTDWMFRNVKFFRCGVSASRQGRVDNLGATQATGTGISSRWTMVDCEISWTLGFGLHIWTDDIRLERLTVHHTGAATTDVAIKIGGCSRPVLDDVTVYLNAGDGCDLFDSRAPKVCNLVSYMNGGIGLDIKWNSTNNYNSPERAEVVNVDACHNWSVGANLSQPRMAVTNVKANGNGGSGVTIASGSTGTVDLSRYSTFTAIEASSNGGRGVVLSGDRHVLIGFQTHGNQSYGIYNNDGTNHTLIACRARDNYINGIYHGPTVTGIQQQSCTTQDPNGQWVADAAATFLLANGYGEQAAGTGNPPTAASWPVGAFVVNTSDSTKWRRNFTTFVAA